MSYYHHLIKSAVVPAYPASLKLFIDAGNPASYSGSGTTVTDLIGTQNGTLVNGVGYSSADGGKFVLDGVNDYIDFGTNLAIQPTSARTVSIWFNLSTLSSVNVIYGDGDWSTGYKGVIMWHDTGTGYRSTIANASSYNLINTGVKTKDIWYYMTLSFNGTTIKTYINGVLKSTVSQTLTVVNNYYPTFLGNGSVLSQPFVGSISQMKIYDVALSDAEVTTDFNEFKARYGY